MRHRDGGALGRVEVNLWNQSWEEGSIDPGTVWGPALSLNTKRLRGNQGERLQALSCVFSQCVVLEHRV